MRNRFLEKLERLHKEMLEMGMLCEKAIMKTYKLLLSEEKDQDALIKEIDQLEHEIDRCWVWVYRASLALEMVIAALVVLCITHCTGLLQTM